MPIATPGTHELHEPHLLKMPKPVMTVLSTASRSAERISQRRRSRAVKSLHGASIQRMTCRDHRVGCRRGAGWTRRACSPRLLPLPQPRTVVSSTAKSRLLNVDLTVVRVRQSSA